jgi:pimeloyl-ACP methyl ester carboxylesterase
MLMFLTGCAVPSMNQRLLQTRNLVKDAGWSEINFQTSYFNIKGFVSSGGVSKNKLLTVYIEGDGLAWITKSRMSPDPTPVNPLGLKLALLHPKNPVVYLARPCQFGQTKKCSNRYWTSGRFSPEVILSYEHVFDELKKRFQIEKFQVIGYSGGGAVAALIAAKRDDVAMLITIAGNLDHLSWTKFHRISGLSESLNPADFWQQLTHIPQVHFVGGKDKVIPPVIVESFAAKFPVRFRPKIRIVESATHMCCWEQFWPDLYLEAVNN